MRSLFFELEMKKYAFLDDTQTLKCATFASVDKLKLRLDLYAAIIKINQILIPHYHPLRALVYQLVYQTLQTPKILNCCIYALAVDMYPSSEQLQAIR